MRKLKKVLIDCDPGIDDALAILFALAQDRLRVEAITTVYGNVSVRRCTDNLINILRLSGLKVLPQIGIGSKKPLSRKRLKPRTVHGRDGLGDTDLGPPKTGLIINDGIELAVSEILAKRIDYIIATGPLTNIAKIIRRDPRISHLVKGIYIMGGSLFVKGNITPYAEFNIYNDPEAAKEVFDSKIPKTLVSLDVTREVILRKRDLARFKKKEDELSRFITHIANFAIDYHRRYREAKGAFMNDPLSVGIAIDEDICRYGQGTIDVKLTGPERGRVIVKKDTSGILYCKDLEVKRFKRLFLDSLERLCKESVN